ncbi:hypothetical protein BH731_07070 [Enterococcus hirae]|nr:hypothetical protein BH731_07070 [Enterococcus hirae]OQO38182.1 hypothetical protein BH738_05075 [Enterococcus hirae]OQO56866.1 hypothetical protein BH736_00500 [Enterococcus hirae]
MNIIHFYTTKELRTNIVLSFFVDRIYSWKIGVIFRHDRLLLALQSLRENYFFLKTGFFAIRVKLTRDTMNRHFDGNRERRRTMKKEYSVMQRLWE